MVAPLLLLPLPLLRPLSLSCLLPPAPSGTCMSLRYVHSRYHHHHHHHHNHRHHASSSLMPSCLSSQSEHDDNLEVLDGCMEEEDYDWDDIDDEDNHDLIFPDMAKRKRQRRRFENAKKMGAGGAYCVVIACICLFILAAHLLYLTGRHSHPQEPNTAGLMQHYREVEVDEAQIRQGR